MSALGLYRLLAPQFLAGFTFPDEVDGFLSKLGVVDMTAVHDVSASVITGTLSFGDAPRTQPTASGSGRFRWDAIRVRFRLTVPRDGAAFIDGAVHDAASPANALADLLDRFLPVDATAATPSEYPGVRFRLELLLDEVAFELGNSWAPGKLDADHRIVRDPTVPGPVRIVLPKVVLAYEQRDDLQGPPAFNLVSWGSGGFDAPSDVLAGELVRMEPPIAAHRDGRLGFGLGAVVVDFDPDATPPEILAIMGTDESFEGIYVQSARIYYADEHKDLALNAGIKDLLVSFDGEVSFDLSLDLIGPERTLSAVLTLVDGGANVPVSPGRREDPPSTAVSGGRARATAAAVGRVQVIGGVPPYTTISVRVGGTERYDPATRTASFEGLATGAHDLVLTVTDSGTGAEQQTYLERIALTIVPSPSAAVTEGAPADSATQAGGLPAITHTGGGAGARGIAPAGTVSGTRERFRVFGPGTPTVHRGRLRRDGHRRPVRAGRPRGHQRPGAGGPVPGPDRRAPDVPAGVHQAMAAPGGLADHPGRVRDRHGDGQRLPQQPRTGPGRGRHGGGPRLARVRGCGPQCHAGRPRELRTGGPRIRGPGPLRAAPGGGRGRRGERRQRERSERDGVQRCAGRGATG